MARLDDVTDDPYDKDENVFRTDGRDVCHWCYLRPQEYKWKPFGTRTCGYCESLIDEGRQWEIVEGLAARMTVRDRWYFLDPEEWREHEHARLARWLEVRTTRKPIPPRPPRPVPQEVDHEFLRDLPPDEPFNPDDI